MFTSHSNQAFSREQILKKVWGDDYFGTDRVVDDLIRRIRKKLTNKTTRLRVRKKINQSL